MNTSYTPRLMVGAFRDPISFNSQNNPVKQVLNSFKGVGELKPRAWGCQAKQQIQYSNAGPTHPAAHVLSTHSAMLIPAHST